MPTRCASLRQAVEAVDPQAVRTAAHSLKGSAGNLGARQLAALCQEIELIARQGSLEGIAALRRASRGRSGAGGGVPPGGARRSSIFRVACANSPRFRVSPVRISSACCAYGVTLSDDEAAAISRAYGADKAYRTRWGEWRTRVRGGRCVFLRENICTIHAEPFYPAVCRGFPWIDAETGGPYRVRSDDLPGVRDRPS